MGTRHLIGVIYGGEYKIAQYGQWDGYIEGGQGERVLNFIKTSDMSILKAKLSNCRFITDSEMKELFDTFVASLPKKDQMSNYDITEAFFKEYPELCRDTGAGILDIVYSSDTEVLLRDDHGFLDDTVFCEFAYIIDLDNNTFNCYTDSSEKYAECDLAAIPTVEELEAIYNNRNG